MGLFYGQRQRVYISPELVPSPGMIMAVKGGKAHITVFRRKRTAPGAGRAEVKEAFAGCAHETAGEPSRLKRNEKLRACMLAKHLATGEFRKKSRAKLGSPLYGRVYVIKEGKLVGKEEVKKEAVTVPAK
jgi:hypothetical protein